MSGVPSTLLEQKIQLGDRIGPTQKGAGLHPLRPHLHPLQASAAPHPSMNICISFTSFVSYRIVGASRFKDPDELHLASRSFAGRIAYAGWVGSPSCIKTVFNALGKP